MLSLPHHAGSGCFGPFFALQDVREVAAGMQAKAENLREEIRNLAIVAHVDHGKTTLIDAMLWQCALFDAADDKIDWLPDSIDLDREKVVTVMAKTSSVLFRGTRINILDTPGHADFSGEVPRILRMVEGLLLLVDACEGPLPQSRFVLHRAIERGLRPIVVINKIDRPEADPERTLREISAMLADLGASTEQMDFPVLYCNALRGRCRRERDGKDEPLLPLFETILDTVPPPAYDPAEQLQFLITMFDYDDYLGRLALGRVFNGEMKRGEKMAHCRLDGSVGSCELRGMFGYDGLRRAAINRAGPGDIISVTGLEAASIGETIADARHPVPLPPITVDEPTIKIRLSVNDSPLAGLEGEHTSVGMLRERLWRELLTNDSISIGDASSESSFELVGRDELQLAILIAIMRREGFEFQVDRPSISTLEIDGVIHEPIELLIVDCPEEYVGVVAEKIAVRKGRLAVMVNHGSGRVRMEFHIPSRGLIGFRTEYLNDTRGTGIMDHLFERYEAWRGDIPHRSTGVLVADRPGRATLYAIEHLQPRGAMFVAPGDQIYEGMIVGKNSRANDLDVNIVKEERQSGASSPAGPKTFRLLPPRSMSLEQALEFIRGDELIEVTPKSLRLRKKVLNSRDRRPKA
jgi:GTP-binding protein